MSEEEPDSYSIDISKAEAEAFLGPIVQKALPGYFASLPPDQREESKKHLYGLMLRIRKLLDSGAFDRDPDGGVTTVYRFFDKQDRLLYVGITNRGTQRIKAHAKVQSWWIQVKTATFVHYESRLAAQIAEAEAIRDERPQYNKAHPNVDVLKLLLLATGPRE